MKAIFQHTNPQIGTQNFVDALKGTTWHFESIKRVELRGNWELPESNVNHYETVQFLPVALFRRGNDTAWYIYGTVFDSQKIEVPDGTPAIFQLHPYLERGELRTCEKITFDELHGCLKDFNPSP